MANTSGAIRAGRAFVELLADPSPLIQSLNKVKARLETFRQEVGKPALLAGGAILAPMAKFFADAARQGFQVDKLANQFNTSAAGISTLRGAFEQAGVAGEEFQGILEGLATKISAAADSRDELIHGLTGLRGDMLIGRDINSQLDIIAEKFKGIVLAEDQMRVAGELGLPKGLIPWLKKGKAGLDELRQAAVENGDMWDPQTAKEAAEAYREFHRVGLAVKSVLLEIGKALLGEGKSFADFGKEIRERLKEMREWIKEHKTIVTLGVVLGAVLAGLGAVLTTVATAMKALTAFTVAYNAATRIQIVLDAVKFVKSNPALAAGAVAAVVGAVKLGEGELAFLDKPFDEAKKKKAEELKKFMSDEFAGGRLEQGRPRIGPVAPMLYEAARGTFGGPIQQQLGYGENVAQRQLDIVQGMAQDSKDMLQEVRETKAAIEGLINGFQVR